MAQKSSNKNRRKKIFGDIFAIFYSEEDQYWVAHSLRTDQFGTGDCVVDALIDGMKAVDQVIALSKKKPEIQILSEAPEEIKQIVQTAKRLPDEIYEIAHKKLYGNWPSYKVKIDIPHTDSFKRRVMESICP